MGYRVKGTLKLPDGTPASNAEIEFISRKNFSPLLQELKSNIKCSATGAYDVTLEYGEYAVIAYPGGTYPAALGTIILAADTVAGQDLPTLLQQAGWQPATPEYIQQIVAWLAETGGLASQAAASATAAKVSETSAAASKDSATTSATAATNKASEASASAATAASKATEAINAATSATASKNAAASSATTASNGASTTTTKASEAAASATNAAASAATATTKASEAAASATSAANSASSAGAAVLDAERRSLERATGGMQTIIYDGTGNANAMFVLPRFRYEDLVLTADMGSGDVTAFDFGSGSIKSEIFIGAYLASGSGAVSAPRQDPRNWLDHTAARNACAAKGAGWHLMTAHEWAAIALWCMANGYEPIGNTNWGRSHAKTWMVGDRADNRAPGDAAGTGRTQTGSMGVEATHTRTLGGIADLVGNVWEWQDGFLLQDGRFKISAYNNQGEVGWAFADAFLDASTPTGGSAILSNAVNNRLGAIGDNANAGNSASVEWRAMTKSGSYVSNQAMKRLLLEPAGALPQGGIFIRNFGERLPIRGGSWHYGADTGLAALGLADPRVSTVTNLGFRPAFA